MRILCCVSNLPGRNTGHGGHFHSVRTFVDAMRGVGMEIDLVVFGQASSVLPDAVLIPGTSVKTSARRLIEHLNGRNPILHGYDTYSILVAGIVARRLDLPLVGTKCGGAMPKFGLYPPTGVQIGFSEEDRRFFEGLGYEFGKDLFLVPSRVVAPEQDSERIARLRTGRVRDGETVVLRIGSVVDRYRLPLVQGAALTRELQEMGRPATYLVVGTLVSPGLVDELVSLGVPRDNIVTDEWACKRAAGLIGAGDVIVGTGRSLMEAAAVGRPIFAPLANADLPAPLTDQTFPELAARNFSPRATLSGVDEARLREMVREGLEDLPEMARTSLRLFNEHFSVQRAVDVLTGIYERAEAPRQRSWRQSPAIIGGVTAAISSAAPIRQAKRALKGR